jgi:hypothetical protein
VPKGGPLNDEQERRVGVNEALFREVNEQIRSLADDESADGNSITVVCECGDADCTERVELLLSEYERIRSDSLLYVVTRGHNIPAVERVVERRDGWEIVRKVGEAGEVAEETDPRS